MPDFTIYRHFDDSELQKYLIEDITIYIYLCVFGRFLQMKKLHGNLCFCICFEIFIFAKVG